MPIIRLYRWLDRMLSLILRKIEAIVFSKWGFVLLALECWFDGPWWARRMIKDELNVLIPNLLIAPVFADRSKTLYTRFKEKRHLKIRAIYTGLCDLYTMQIVAWRRTVWYYRREPWFKSFVFLSWIVIWYYITEYMFIYNSTRILNEHKLDEYLYNRYPRRVTKLRKFRRINWRIKRYLRYFHKPPRNFLVLDWFENRTRGYSYRMVMYKFNNVYSSTNSLLGITFIKVYLFITIYYYFAVWYYHEELDVYLNILFYGLIDDWYKVVDDDDVPGGDTIIIECSRYVVKKLLFKKLKFDLLEYFSWRNDVFGLFYKWNTKFVRDHRFRRIYWFKYLVAWIDIKLGKNPPFIYYTMTERELYFKEVRHDAGTEEWFKNYESRRFKNRWFVKRAKEWFLSDI